MFAKPTAVKVGSADEQRCVHVVNRTVTNNILKQIAPSIPALTLRQHVVGALAFSFSFPCGILNCEL